MSTSDPGFALQVPVPVRGNLLAKLAWWPLCFKNVEFFRGWSIGLAVTVISIVAIQGCSANTDPAAGAAKNSDSRALRRGIGGEPASLDPAKAADTFSFELIRDLYEGLATESPDGTVIPGVASSWIVNASGKQYVFQLRPDARWSNGRHVRASDFVEAWRRVVDPKRGSPVADILRPVARAAAIIRGELPPSALGITAAREDQLIVDLEQPAPYFPQLLTHSATFPVFSEETAKSHNPNDWVSNGPYVLAAWTPGSTLKLRRNPMYWNVSNVRISNVIYFPIPDENSEFQQYRAGQLDITQSVPSAALPMVRADFPNELVVSPFLATAYYALNLNSPFFASNLNLRKALALAIDRQVLEQTILPFGQTPAYGFVPPGTWNYDPQFWEWRNLPDRDRLQESRRLYELAGFSERRPLRIRVLFNSNNSIKQVAIAIASMWKEALGVDTEFVDEEYRVFLDDRRNTSKWEVARLGWTADYNDAGNFLDTLRGGSPNNDARYDRKEFNDLLDRAATSIDPLARRHLLQDAEKLMLSDYPILPIYFFSSKRLIRPYVHGAQANPLNRLYSKHLTIDGH